MRRYENVGIQFLAKAFFSKYVYANWRNLKTKKSQKMQKLVAKNSENLHKSVLIVKNMRFTCQKFF